MKIFPYSVVIVFKNEPWAAQIKKLDSLDFDRIKLLKELVDRKYEQFKKKIPCSNVWQCHGVCCKGKCTTCDGTGFVDKYSD